MIEERLAQQRMWFTSSTPTLEVGSVVNFFNPEVEASARDLCENLRKNVVVYLKFSSIHDHDPDPEPSRYVHYLGELEGRILFSTLLSCVWMASVYNL